MGLLARAAASGAAAMIFQELVHALVSDDPEDADEGSRSLADRLISGTARGLVYGAVAEPRLPGPPVLRGVLYGSGNDGYLEHLVFGLALALMAGETFGGPGDA